LTRPRLVLVVDDDLDIREIVMDVLVEAGMSAIGAADGADALRRLQAGLRPDLILLDLMMPVMDGLTFRRLQLADPELASIPVVILSAYRDLAEKQRGLATKILAKPIDLDELVGAVREFAAA
jgi:CheY-like chemotaxis protein